MDQPTQRTPTGLAAELFLLLFPVAHLVYLPVGGAVATGADVVLLLLLTVWVLEMAARPGAAAAWVRVLRGGTDPGMPPRGYLLGMLLLLAFAGWVALSGLWGFHPRYAHTKGVGLAALGLGALALATSGLGWRRAVDAWLAGAGLALAATLVLGLTGPGILRERMLLGGTGVSGLPFPRVSGPFLHPNMMGDYLVVSALLLWGRWPALVGRARAGAVVLAGALTFFLAMSASTAWVGAGVAVAWVGRRMVAEGMRAAGLALRVVGVGVAVATVLLLVLPSEFGLLGLEVVTGGMRPAIWEASLGAVAASPLLGVGAAPYLAEAADPLLGGALGLYDAHNAFLSVLGQFGVVGGVLAGAGLAMAVWGSLGPARPMDEGVSRVRVALLLALLAVTVNGFFLASEDLRHLWALVGVLGMTEPAGPEEPGR